MNDDLKGCDYIKISSIIMIAIASITLVFYGLGLLGYSIFTANFGDNATLLDKAFYITLIVATMSSFFWLVFSIIGVVFCKKANLAIFCLVFGILLIIVSLLTTGLFICSTGLGILPMTGLLLSLLLPGLYTYGAVLNLPPKGTKAKKEKINKEQPQKAIAG